MTRSFAFASLVVAATFVFAACVNLTPRWQGRNDAGDKGGQAAFDGATGGSGGSAGLDAASGGSRGDAATGGTATGGTAVGGAGGLPATGGTTVMATGGAGGLPATGGTTAVATGGTTTVATGGVGGLPATGGTSGTAGAGGDVARDAGSTGGSPRDGAIDTPSSADRPADQATGGTRTGGATTGGTGGTATGGTGGTLVVDAGTVADTVLPKDGGIDVPPDLGTGGTGGAGTGGAGGTGGTGVDAPIAPTIVSIDFVGGGTPITGTVAMAATESAGVRPATHWNRAASNAGTLSSLVAADGATTSASVTWDSPIPSGETSATWSLYWTDAPGDTRMMNGYLDPRAIASPATVTVTGLPSPMSSGYDVYVYCYMDMYTGSGTRTAQYKIEYPSISPTNSATHTVTQTAPSETAFLAYTQVTSEGGMGNYVVFRNVTGTSFKLTATPGTTTGYELRAPVNGLQIVYPPGS